MATLNLSAVVLRIWTQFLLEYKKSIGWHGTQLNLVSMNRDCRVPGWSFFSNYYSNYYHQFPSLSLTH
jgi:hypothetical protein